MTRPEHESSRVEWATGAAHGDAGDALKRALEDLDTGRNAASLELLDRLVEGGEVGVEANLARAVALARMGRSQPAVESLEQLIEVRPDHPRAGDLLRELGASDLGQLLRMARAALDTDDVATAFTAVAEAKAARHPLLGLDHLRALCFLRMARSADACEALKEELRHFPDNGEAQELLDELLADQAEALSPGQWEPEFRELLQSIRPYTMVPSARLYSLYRLARGICLDDVPGNFVECGVAAGGSSALLAWVVNRYSTRPRLLYAFDSFEGMPAPTRFDTQGDLHADATGWGAGTCAAPVDCLHEICRRLGVLEGVRAVPGYFEQTLSEEAERVGEIAFLHLDGDWYESTRAILESFYEQVVPGGILQFDDYGCWDGCRRAVREFEARRDLRFRLQPIDTQGVWARKET